MEFSSRGRPLEPGEASVNDGGPPLYVTEADVENLLRADPTYTGMIDTLERAFKDYARGNIVTPAQERARLVWPPHASVRPYDRDMRILPAMVPSVNAAGLRMGCKSEVNPGSTSYTILLEFDRMQALAFIEDHHLHGVRSGVPTGIGIRHLANPDASIVAVIGCGRISQVQLACAVGEREISSIKVYSRNPDNRERFAREQEKRFDIETVAANTVQEAIADADIVVSATNSHNATVFDGNDLKKGSFVASVTPGEIDATTALRSRVVLTSSNRVATDYTPQEPIASLVRSGRLDLDRLPLLSEILIGEQEGRQSEDQIVFLFSPGIGFCDIAAARHVYDLATGTRTHELQNGK